VFCSSSSSTVDIPAGSAGGAGMPAGGPAADGGGAPPDGGMPADMSGAASSTDQTQNTQTVSSVPFALIEAVIQSLQQIIAA